MLALLAGVWIGTSFWGAMDTAFCRIYHVPCRSWVAQKRFGLAMLVVAALFIAATLTLPAAEALLISGRTTCRSASPTSPAWSRRGRSC